MRNRIDQVVEIFEKLGKITSVLANCLVIIGITIAYIQLRQTQHIDEKRVAIEAVRTAEDQFFLKTIARLKTFSKHVSTNASNSELLTQIYETKEYRKALSLMTDDINYILSYYNYISMLFDKKIADGDILITGSYIQAREFSKILNKVSNLPDLTWVLQARQDFDRLLMEFIFLDWATEKEGRYNF